MPQPSREIAGSSIVLVGSFNPAIFQPLWFAKQGLLSDNEAENANIEVIHSQVSQFNTEQFVFQVTTDRLTAITKPSAADAPLRDLIMGTFYILEHTPIHAMGLNKQMHYAMHTDEAWHRIGDRLVPKDVWNGLIGDRRPGMRDVQVLYPAEKEDQPAVTVTVQPSVLVPQGVYFDVNCHFASPEPKNAEYFMGILISKWEESQQDAERIVRHILDWAAV